MLVCFRACAHVHMRAYARVRLRAHVCLSVYMHLKINLLFIYLFFNFCSKIDRSLRGGNSSVLW